MPQIIFKTKSNSKPIVVWFIKLLKHALLQISALNSSCIKQFVGLHSLHTPMPMHALSQSDLLYFIKY